MRPCYVYIVASRTRVLYVGMTNDLQRRISEHKQKLIPGFTANYNVNRLVWYEAFPDAAQAIAAEKRIKGWTRAKKVALIEAKNPEWHDLAEPVSAKAATPGSSS
jgi:putative endonuclease